MYIILISYFAKFDQFLNTFISEAQATLIGLSYWIGLQELLPPWVCNSFLDGKREGISRSTIEDFEGSVVGDEFP